MKKYFWILGVISVLAIGIVTISLNRHSNTPRPSASSSSRLRVVTSFYPMYFFASRIGGDRAEVTNLVPAGSEPHDYEPTPREIATISESDILVLNGNGLEPWGDRLGGQLQEKSLRILNTSEGLAHQTMTEEDQTVTDPHIWLDPLLAKQEVDAIAQSFSETDPANASYYAANAATLKQDMDRLDADYRQGLSRCEKNTFVTSHAAFGYLASRYQLRQIAISGVSPDEEPSPKTLSDITDLVRRESIPVIFFESLVSPELSETIANETGTKTLVLDPIEGISDDDLTAGRDYFTVMRDNLTNLRTALRCQ